MKKLTWLLSLLLLTACAELRTDELLLEKTCRDYTIAYERELGLFIISYNDRHDTLSLGDNWNYALYRYRQCRSDIPQTMSYDEFLKSAWFCLPGGEKWYAEMNRSPQAVFDSPDAPRLCDCIDEQGNYDSRNPNCEQKFQVFRSSFSDSLSWYFSFYRDRCKGTVADSVGFTMWKDTLISQAERAERLERRRRFVADSLEGTATARQCSGSNYLAPHQRSSSFRITEQCRVMTRHRSGRCGKHR